MKKACLALAIGLLLSGCSLAKGDAAAPDSPHRSVTEEPKADF